MREFKNMPDRICKLPISKRGFPIPYFAAMVNGERDFRIVCPTKMKKAIKLKKCWVCGERLGKYKAFVIGPMCGINRTISDPPSHPECATFSALNCPFLSSPMAQRNARNLPDHISEAAGIGLKRNPKACAVWVTKSYEIFRPHKGNSGILFSIGNPEKVDWYSGGRPATYEEVCESIETGLPSLIEMAKDEGPEAEQALAQYVAEFVPLLPRCEAQ